MMKDLVTPVPVEEINAVVKKCLEKAALINYTKMSEAAKIEGQPASSQLVTWCGSSMEKSNWITKSTGY